MTTVFCVGKFKFQDIEYIIFTQLCRLKLSLFKIKYLKKYNSANTLIKYTTVEIYVSHVTTVEICVSHVVLNV